MRRGPSAGCWDVELWPGVGKILTWKIPWLITRLKRVNELTQLNPEEEGWVQCARDKIPGFVYACTNRLECSHTALYGHPGMSDHKKILPESSGSESSDSTLVLPTPSVHTHVVKRNEEGIPHRRALRQQEIWQISFWCKGDAVDVHSPYCHSSIPG